MNAESNTIGRSIGNSLQRIELVQIARGDCSIIYFIAEHMIYTTLRS